MKKVAIISLGNIYLTPYITNYLSILDDQRISYDVIYWNRHLVNDQVDSANKNYCFELKSDIEISKVRKISGYFRFIKYVKRIVNQEKYDGIIYLQTTSAVLLWFSVNRKYINRYIVDIRDYTFEHLGLYKRIEKKTVSNSYLTIISSKGYESFLPKGQYALSHNYTKVPDGIREQFRNRKKDKEKIRISFIGLIRFMEQNKRIIKAFGNDERFELFFAGKNADNLKEFIEREGIHNVVLHDYFDKKDTLMYYVDTDIVMNLYGNHDRLLDYAISNKLYYSASLYIPILVCEDTYMEAVVRHFGLGITADVEKDNCIDLVYDYYKNINWTSFSNNCDEFITCVESDILKTNHRIQEYLEAL